MPIVPIFEESSGREIHSWSWVYFLRGAIGGGVLVRVWMGRGG